MGGDCIAWRRQPVDPLGFESSSGRFGSRGNHWPGFMINNINEYTVFRFKARSISGEPYSRIMA